MSSNGLIDWTANGGQRFCQASAAAAPSPSNLRKRKTPMWSKLVTLVILASPLLALAGQWEICDYTVQIENTALSGVRATVKEAAPKNPDLCLKAGASLSFSPESEDYQSVLPRKRWPKVGTTAALRYRQLPGFCKRDGDTQPCTIRHYSVLTRR